MAITLGKNCYYAANYIFSDIWLFLKVRPALKRGKIDYFHESTGFYLFRLVIHSQALVWQLAQRKTQRVFAGWVSRLQVVKGLECRAESRGYRIKGRSKTRDARTALWKTPCPTLGASPRSPGSPPCAAGPSQLQGRLFLKAHIYPSSWRTALGVRVCLSIHGLQGIFPQEAHILSDMGAPHS